MPQAETHNTIIIGSGHAGLAASYCLTRLQREHVVLERGQVAESWRQRWDAFNLLISNWMLQLPRFRSRPDSARSPESPESGRHRSARHPIRARQTGRDVCDK